MKNKAAEQRINSILAGALALAACLTISAPALPHAQAQAGVEARYYTETGKTLAPEFVSYFDSKGGVPIFGYPLTDAETESGVEVQYLERARIEYHPENRGTQYEVQLGLLGTILTGGRQFQPATTPQNAPTTPDTTYYPETRHTLSGAFLRYWQRNGGLALFGYPISEPVQEGGYTVQYFERNRFELHPEAAGTQYEVQLGLLGRDLLAQRVQVRESSVTLPTYAYEQAFYTPANDPVAPYPRLDMAKVGPPAPRSYKLIVLENKYLKLSIMPQLGGRLYEAVYKLTGHDELYRNPVIKPSSFGERGWWLAAGGQEWAAPTEEHGLMEYLPWNALVQRNSDGGATVTLSATDKLTGMLVTGTVTLSPEDAAYTVSARMENRTGQQQRGQLWTNALLAPGGTNHASPRTRFILPTNEFIVHSTSDTGLPPEHGVITWPRYEGRDVSDVGSWTGWLGGFALPKPERGSFAAVYNPDADEGMVKSFKNKDMLGLKIFGFGPRFNPRIYTDDDSSYAELWGGITPTFWDNAIFPPGGALGWSERWQPVTSLGGVSLASEWGTVSLDGTTMRVLATRRTEGATAILHRPNGTSDRIAFNAYPERPTILSISGPVSSLEILSPNGASLLKGTPLGR